MSYIVSFDDESGKYQARRPKTYYPIGKGDSLYDAIDDLDSKLLTSPKSDSVVELVRAYTCYKCGKPVTEEERSHALDNKTLSKQKHEILCASCLGRTTAVSIKEIQRN